MCLGLSQFKGDVLMVMSGRSLVSKEFDQLVSQSAAWQRALRAPGAVVRVDLPNADQAYSNIASQCEIIELITRWMCNPAQVQGHRGAAAVLAATQVRLRNATGQES